jgi:hypothetical protein
MVPNILIVRSFSMESKGKSNSFGGSVEQGVLPRTLEGHDDW